METDAYILCLRCRNVFTDGQVEGYMGCPTCGNPSVPGDTRQKATLTLTHHEWRVLFMWAENWAAQCGRDDEAFVSPIPGIIREARRQAPDLPGLSLREDVQELANLGIAKNITLHSADGVEKIEPERKH